MKRALFLACVAWCSAPALAVRFRREPDSQIQKVITLLKELKTSIEEDGTSEQASYDKYACWCEDTLAEKATDITTGKETIEDLSKEILKLKGGLGSHTAEIAQLKKDIAENLESQKTATEVRTKERAEYVEKKEEAEQCIGALEAAIRVLSGAGAGKKGFLETLQEAQLLSVVAGVRNVLRQPVVSKEVPDQDLQLVRRFLDQPEDFVGGRAGGISAAQIANNPFGDYAPKSTQIQGILKSMYDSFVGDLEKSNAEEGSKEEVFQELMETKRTELKTLQGSLTTQEMDEATKQKSLADNKASRDDAESQLKTDKEVFAETKDSCKKKAGEWASRQRLRTEELSGISEALEILEDPDNAKSLEDASATNFLQVSSRSSPAGSEAAYARLRQLARKAHSINLAKLAVEVRAGGHFDKVMAAIDGMIKVLRQEEKEDIAHRDRCEMAQGKSKNDLEDLDHDITKVGKELDLLDDQVTELQGKIDTIGKEINATKKDKEDLKGVRTQEQEDFVKAMKADQEAIEVLEKAITALKRYQKKALLQTRADPDGTEPSFSDGKGKTGSHAGIITLLNLIKENFQQEIAQSRKDEEKAQQSYIEEVNALQRSIEAQEKSRTAAAKELAAVNLKISDKEELKLRKEGAKTSEEELKGALEKDCAWVATHFDTRREKRKKEMDGLAEAKSFLAGAETGDEGLPPDLSL